MAFQAKQGEIALCEGLGQGEDGLAEALSSAALIGITPQEGGQPLARRRLAGRQRQIGYQRLRFAQIEDDRPAVRILE